MKIREVMTKNVESISSDASILEAASKMKVHDIGFLPVLNGEKVSGTVTDRDIVIRAIAAGLDPSETKVADVMSKGIETLSPDDDVTVAAKLMEKKQIRRLVVQDSHGAYLGVFSLGDLAHRTHKQELSGEALDKVCAE